MIKFFKGLGPVGWIVIILLFGGFIYAGTWAWHKIVPQTVAEAKQLAVNDLPPLDYDKTANAPFRALPEDPTDFAELKTPQRRAGIMGWNAQSGVLNAVGGIQTVKGSIMDSLKVNIKLINQNDCVAQVDQLYAFIEDYAHGNKNSSKGYHYIAQMGDGVHSYIRDMNIKIESELGPEYIIRPFTAFGLSFGEDRAIFEDDSFLNDPNVLRGTLWVGVIRDGDWNLLMKWADLNGIPVNNDLTTFDPDAINWMAAQNNDYLKATEAYVNKVKEKRKIVHAGRITDRDTTVMVRGVVTWTPGDKQAFEGRGGSTVTSTADFSAQMANVWMGCDKWLKDNQKEVNNFILGGCLGGDQVKSHDSALRYATEIAANLYAGDLTAQEWYDLYKGIEIEGEEAGGSRVFNLADQAEYFGINGSEDKYKAVWNTYADLCMRAYPDIIPDIYPYEKAVDLSYLKDVWSKNKNNPEMTVASKNEFTKDTHMGQVVTSKAFNIQFETNSAEIKQESMSTLEKLAQDFLIADGLVVSIEGHTDNVGDPGSNKKLSQKRAESVRKWFLENYPKAFRNKINDVVGYGEDKPVASNDTRDGQSKNRRVEIKLGKAK